MLAAVAPARHSRQAGGSKTAISQYLTGGDPEGHSRQAGGSNRLSATVAVLPAIGSSIPYVFRDSDLTTVLETAAPNQDRLTH